MQLNSLMNYSTLLHSGIVNPKPTEIKEESSGPEDAVTMDIPLLIRMFELMREDVKDDKTIHVITDRLLQLRNKGIITMDDYDFIIGKSDNNAELESIKKLAGI